MHKLTLFQERRSQSMASEASSESPGRRTAIGGTHTMATCSSTMTDQQLIFSGILLITGIENATLVIGKIVSLTIGVYHANSLAIDSYFLGFARHVFHAVKNHDVARWVQDSQPSSRGRKVLFRARPCFEMEPAQRGGKERNELARGGFIVGISLQTATATAQARCDPSSPTLLEQRCGFDSLDLVPVQMV